MSILLDALRKSEKGQRPVEAPTIHSEQHISVDSAPLKKGPMAVLLLLAFTLIAWVIWHQYDSSSVGYQPPVAMPVKQDDALKTPVSSMQPSATATNSGIPDGPVVKQQRTPVESFQQAPTDSTKPKTVKPKTRPTIINSGKVKPKPRPADPAVNKTGTVRSEKSGSNKPADDMRPQPISYWELPDAVRADVPQMKFTVLVYAGEPADRFVLINGQRLAEGDSYQQGLVVEEIRREGVVFSYRLYKFLVER